MKNKAAGFYADSLEMLLDTMCNMLGAVVFIALLVAICGRDVTAPTPADYAGQTRQLSNDLAAVVASNSVVESQIHGTLQRLQEPPPRSQTVAMRLPNIAPNTTKQPWTVIVRDGKLYPLDLLSSDGRGLAIRNTRAVQVQSGTHRVELRPGQGEEPERGVTAMVQAFKASSKTDFYFVFCVYDDSFDAFARARETAMNLGFQYGWEPLPTTGPPLRLGPGPPILPQN